MPACIYDAQDAIPAELRGFFKQRADGKWVFDHTQFEGIAELVNPALEANRKQWMTNRDTERQLRTQAETEAAAAKAALAALQSPGSVVLSEADAKAWQAYTSLGDLKTVKEKVAGFDTANAELSTLKQTELWRGVAGQTGLNPDVLIDVLRSERGKGVELFAKDAKSKKDGKDVDTKVPYVRWKVPGASPNEFSLKEAPLTDYATQQNWPGYIVSGLTATPQQQQGQPPAAKPNFTYPPKAGKAASDDKGGGGIDALINKLVSSDGGTVKSPFATPANSGAGA